MKIQILVFIAPYFFLSCQKEYVAIYDAKVNGSEEIIYRHYLVSDGKWRKLFWDTDIWTEIPYPIYDTTTIKLYINNYEANYRYKIQSERDGYKIKPEGQNYWNKYYSLDNDTIHFVDDVSHEGYCFYEGIDTIIRVNGEEREAYIFRYGIPNVDSPIYPIGKGKGKTKYNEIRCIDKKWNIPLQYSFRDTLETKLDTIVFCSKKEQKNLLKGIIFKNVSDTIHKNQFARINYSNDAREIINGTFNYDH
ncbi:MAG: hypothetical protein N4A35_11380 [Flavobacteriales bacterium]|jgi:hypothetical protein|nr:hypothetical protein [Flavobacteriales bacterium]